MYYIKLTKQQAFYANFKICYQGQTYGNNLYDQTYNSSLHEKLESIQCNAFLVLTGAIMDSSKEKIYQ